MYGGGGSPLGYSGRFVCEIEAFGRLSPQKELRLNYVTDSFLFNVKVGINECLPNSSSSAILFTFQLRNSSNIRAVIIVVA